MSLDYWNERIAKLNAELAEVLKEIAAKDEVLRLYCFECDRYEADPIFLDVEMCSKCGTLIGAAE